MANMINYWWATRPKRKLNSVPEVLALLSGLSLDAEWNGQRNTHLSLEAKLEAEGLKRVGERRDQGGSGARTYAAWIQSLGLTFIQQSTGKMKLTLAGEALMNGSNPVEILKGQVLKYQFPSAYSISVRVADRFKIHPFIFLLKLLLDDRLSYLTEEEIAKIVIVEAENETNKCYEYIVKRILQFREAGDNCLADDFFDKYKPSRGPINLAHPYSHLTDTANTLINWLDYTQLIDRNKDSDKKITVLSGKEEEVKAIVADGLPFIADPEDHEKYQRRYGLAPGQRKDSRALNNERSITPKDIAKAQIQRAFISETLKKPIFSINSEIIDKIQSITGYEEKLIEDILLSLYPHGAIGSFLPEYFEMAFNGREEATEFEKATVEIFREIFKYDARHVGPIGLTPDVLLLADDEGYQAIIDNKAYSKYTISNDHHNRMVHNYIENISNYSDSPYPLAFFTYIAGGFGKTFGSQLQKIQEATGINGSGINVSNMIKLIEQSQEKTYSHASLRDLFSVNREIIIGDLL